MSDPLARETQDSSPSGFRIEVEAAAQGKSGTAVLGVLREGRNPAIGTMVEVAAPGRELIVPSVEGIEMDVRPPKIGLLLGGIRATDIPGGTWICSLQPDLRPP
jgi:hypothetical protein